ncbi:LD-carboxypeptidase [Actinomadura sp. SCN-SB]|uniref:S66 peptidase family protein n=1 Tax=Actinomadura sp. SCN-SB TaxID=3373092 RepID=UPI003753E256
MSGVSRTGRRPGRRGASDRPLDSGAGGLSETDPDRPRRFGRLAPGDRVAVVAPSGPVDPVRLEKGCGILRELGLRVTVAEHALADTLLADAGLTDAGQAEAGPSAEAGAAREGRQRIAGADADRAADLTAAWCDPGVRAVLCARGGYGATRVLDHLDWDRLAAPPGGTAPKILHGSSDITALHMAFGRRLGVTTSFGPMVASELFTEGTDGGTADDDWHRRSLEHFRAVLFGSASAADGRTGTEITGTRVLREGTAEGPLTGGTLSLLAALTGTPYAPPPATGRIVFLEDVAEAPYRVDRMLTQLLQAGWFDGAAGIALGAWPGCGDPAELDAVFAGRLGPLGVPILAGLPVGHGPRQLTLELGAPYRLDTHARTLDAQPGGVR